MSDEQGAHARRVYEAEDRIAKGIGVRRFYVGSGDRWVVFDLSDELTVISRRVPDQAVASIKQRGNDVDLTKFFEGGMAILHAMVDGESANQDQLLVARLTLLRLYDDMILRLWRPWDGQQLFTPVDWSTAVGEKGRPPEPPDTYWLVLEGDGYNFTLKMERPDHFPAVAAPDGQHRHTTRH